MAWLKRFERNPLDLVGPDVAKAPVRKINLSGTVLSFRCPFQTAAIPGFIGPAEFDIDKRLEEDVRNPQNAHVTLYSTGWDLHDRMSWGTPYGGVTTDLILTRNNETRDSELSLFRSAQIKQWIFVKMAAAYGSWNEDMWARRERYTHTLIPEKDFWQYPTTNEDIQEKAFNGIRWFRYEVYQPGRAPRIVFETAISHRHVVRISFSPSSYQGDYFSPEHNVQQASEDLINAIMETVNIQLSPDAQRQFDEVEG